ncbi:MAG: transposase [Candidatus Methanofastidiosia archaeon]|jgi:transposase
MKKLYAGFDIHKEELTGTVMNKQGTIVLSGEFPNNKGAVQSFFTGIPSPQVTIAIEACSIWRGVYRMLTGLGYQVVLADPAKTHLIAGKKKTDEVDSKTLADLLRTGYLPQVYIPSEDVLKLRDIARHRARLVRIRQRLKCSVKSYMNRDGIQYKNSWSKTNMEDLKVLNPHIGHFIDIIEVTTEKIKEVEKKIRQIARNKPLANLLRTIPGVAEFSAYLLTDVPNLKYYWSKHVELL